jgi:orotate phosphoribosyltransferase
MNHPAENYKMEFIEFMVRSGVLTFGDFVTKSGRRTPFFINTGKYDSGLKMARLGSFYAQSLQARMAGRFDVLYGPAYKGIPLVVAASMALAEHHGLDIPFTFNRKERKDHGEGGGLIGHQLREGERIVIVEDVTTAGTSVRESVELLRAAAPIKLAGLIVSVDRQERGAGERGALAELHDQFGLETFAIVTLEEIVHYLHNRPIDGRVVLSDQILAALEAYREQYGAREE